MVILYDEVRQTPKEVTRRIYRHIGVADDFLPPSLYIKPKKNSYNKAIVTFERLAKRQELRKIADLAHQALARLQTEQKGPPLPSDIRARLVELFRPHIIQTQEVLRRLPPENRPTDIDLIKLWN